ncbi:uncharacterized protein LOC114303000 [Camellia sinensis]|uniref:uncharacterized protein LOC114303000 n=1 Tax=Camellia sinensis TaxID=4442 RepID=UPI001036DF16|nr:uncharacterized protein LOC114303000 [Camellia sinensis]
MWSSTESWQIPDATTTGELAKHKYIERHRCEEGSMIVTDLFWANPVSLDLLCIFPRVLIMDCTYKTNRYRLPLLEIVGVTSTHMTFSVAVAYLQIERVHNYAWALQTLRDLMDNSVLPEVIVTDRELALMNAIDNTFLNARHLLCRWHINKNVLTKLLSSTEEEYNDHFATLQKDFSNYSDAIKVESAHARLKRQLDSSQTAFEISFEKMHCLLELQHIQSKRANSVGIDVAACGCVLRRTHGLPCVHEIADYMRQGRPIPLSSIHVEKLELTCIPELKMILKRFNESDIAMKLDMLKKLREIANPASTFLIEPDSTLASSQSKKKRALKVLDKKRNVKTKTYRTRTSLPSAYVGDFPPMLIPFIKLMKDADGDGNCGFRAIAGLLGLGEND